MNRRSFLKFFGIGLLASVATRAAQARVCERQNGLLDRMYPVGSIYITIISANPGTTLGGTWVRFGNGRALVGVDEGDGNFSTVQRTGGAATHTLTVAQMPSHTHSPNNLAVARGALSTTGHSSGGSGGRHCDAGGTVNDTGDGQAHNNLQPYITVYMWRRSA